MEPKFILKVLSPAVGFAFLAAFVLGGDIRSAEAAGSGALSEVYMAQQAGGKGQQKKPAKAVQKEVEKVIKEVQKDVEKVIKGPENEVKKQTKTNQGKALGKARAPGQRVREEAHRLKDMPKEARPGAAKTLRERAMEGSEFEIEKAEKSHQNATKGTQKAKETREKAEVEGGKAQEEAQKEVEEAKKATQETEKAKQEAKKKMEARAEAAEKERATAREKVKRERR